MECLRREAAGVVNTTAHFMSLAEKYIADGNIEAAKEFGLHGIHFKTYEQAKAELDAMLA